MSPDIKINFRPEPDWNKDLTGSEVTVVQTLVNSFEQDDEISERSLSDLILHMHQSDLLHARDSHTAINHLITKGFLQIDGDSLIPTEKFKKLFSE